MPDGTLQILGLGTSPAPLKYDVSGNQPLDLIAVKADFDGSGSGTSFVPVVEILSDASHIMATAKGSTVAAGASATVTFATFLGGTDSGATGDFVEFDVSPTSGDFLDVLTAGPSGAGLVLKDIGNSGDTGILIEEIGDAGMQLNNAGDGDYGIRNQGAGSFTIEQTGNAPFLIRNDGNGGTTIQDDEGVLTISPRNDSLVLAVQFANSLIITGLPTSSPGVSGSVWVSGGVLNIDP